MFRRSHRREKPARIEHRVAEILETGTVKLVLAGFDGVVLCSLAVKLDAGAAGFNLKLLDRFDRNTRAIV